MNKESSSESENPSSLLQMHTSSCSRGNYNFFFFVLCLMGAARPVKLCAEERVSGRAKAAEGCPHALPAVTSPLTGSSAADNTLGAKNRFAS